jgi:spore germination cell wall hydrolase CwlJ-like protein
MKRKEILLKILCWLGIACFSLIITATICFLYVFYDKPTWEVNEPVSMSKQPDYIEVKRDTPVANLVEESETVSYKYYLTDAENEDLCKIAMAEAGNQGITGKALVMRVVLNRMEQWGMSIHDVIRQEGQFTAYSNGHFASAVIDQKCIDALEMVMQGWDESWGALYFESGTGRTWHSEHLDYLFTYGAHKFYK